MSGAQPNPLACPLCRQIDMVQKVSAIVDAGTFNTSHIGPVIGTGYTFGQGGGITTVTGFAQMRGTSQSALSQRLALPRPHFSNYYRSTARSLFLLGLIPIVLIAFLAPFLGFGAGLPILVVVVFIWFAALIMVAMMQRVKAREALPAWQRAYPLWQRLYYCARCDGVFIPGGRTPLISAAQMREFLYASTSGYMAPV